MNFIKKVFDGECDEDVHLSFQKFSKGDFTDRALIKGRKAANGIYTISTTAEFSNGLVSWVAGKLGDDRARVTGVIISTGDLEGEFEYKEKKSFMRVKKYVIDSEMSGAEILELLDKFPKIFFGLSFEAGGTLLKIKAKSPKSGKPSSKGEEKPKADFCRIRTTDADLVRDFIFEKVDWKEVEVSHKFVISEIVVPDDLKDSEDFALVREKARRKGRVYREAVIDGEEIKSEKDFEI